VKPRRPSLDFSGACARWIPSAPGFAHQLNAASSALPYLEPYLIRVLKLAREKLDPAAHAELIRDVDLFNQQEANHFRLHARYNAALRAQYPGLEPFEEQIRRDYEGFLRERSLAWNLAYCEGFECTGLVSAELFFGPAQEFLRDADPAVRDLWSWHLAEEHEHRSVCHDVLRALHPGWLRRLGGYWHFLRHLQAHGNRVARHLHAVDRERGLHGEASRAADARFRRAARRFTLPRTLAILSPRYDPAPRRPTPAIAQALARYEG